MERMKDKGLFFLIGLLSGILISGILILTVHHIQKASRLAAMNFTDNSEFVYTPVNEFTQLEVNSEENVGKIDLNSATLEDLMTLPNIGETKAKAIIAFRETYGDFENINELLYISGIGPEIYKGLEDLVYVQKMD